MPGRPMAAHRVKFLILFTFAVRKFFWFPPPKARDLMPISHTPLEPFVDNDAFTVIDLKTCTKNSGVGLWVVYVLSLHGVEEKNEAPEISFASIEILFHAIINSII